MRLFIFTLLLLLDILCYSQNSDIQISDDNIYELLLDSKEFNDVKFPDKVNSLNKTGQIYEVFIKNDTIFIQNGYLVFKTVDDKINVKYLSIDEGTFDVKMYKEDNLYYIFKIKIGEGKYTYYYFYRKFNWS